MRKKRAVVTSGKDVVILVHCDVSKNTRETLDNGYAIALQIMRRDISYTRQIYQLSHRFCHFSNNTKSTLLLNDCMCVAPRKALQLPPYKTRCPRGVGGFAISYRQYTERGKAIVDEDKVVSSFDFQPTERAKNASQVNLSARLSDRSATPDGTPDGVWRLLRLARGEIGPLSGAFTLLCISSAVSMTVPFAIGRILDIATKSTTEGNLLFGLTMEQFYYSLGTIFVVGAISNFGRIVVLRIVGERIVAKLRSGLFKRTMHQDAEFFDANSRFNRICAATKF